MLLDIRIPPLLSLVVEWRTGYCRGDGKEGFYDGAGEEGHGGGKGSVGDLGICGQP